MTDTERKKRYYRFKPEFRARQLQAVAERHARCSSDPDYCRLVKLRKDIHRIRESRDARLEHAERLERRLVTLGRELVKVQAQWDKRRRPNETR